MVSDPSRARSWLDFGAVIVFLLAASVYANALFLGATLDDVFIVERNPLSHGVSQIAGIFTTSYWGFDPRLPDTSLYRPFTILTFALERSVFGHTLWVSHAVNVLLHATASALVFVTVRRLFEDARIAFAAAILFAVHPAHVEAVAGLVGRAESLAALGILTCVYAWDRARDGHWKWIAIAALACAAGAASKEIGVTAPAVALAAEIVLPERRWLLRGDRRAWIAMVVLASVLGAFLVVHASITEPNRALMGLVGLEAQWRVPTAFAALLEYARLCVFPMNLSADYTLRDVPLVESLVDMRFLAGVALALVLVATAWCARRRAPVVTWGLIVAAITFAPVSNLLFGVGIVVAERALYSPSIGLCAAVGGAFALALQRPAWTRIGWIAFVLVSAGFAVRTWTRTPVWKDNETLGLATLAVAPHSHLAHDILAQFYAAKGDLVAAEPHVRAALETEDCKDMRFLEGEIAVANGRLEEAIRAYRTVIELDAAHAAAYNQLGLALGDAGQVDEAIQTFTAMQQACPDQETAWLNLVFLYSQRGDLERALTVALDAVARFPKSAEVLRTTGAVHAALGHSDEAEVFARRAQSL
ncbi:MAG: tetratricopeptide repeat protein [Planctomycetes bacterium]|nr:tetratricopeptide repeat protein [Planctomycetota bacterium]